MVVGPEFEAAEQAAWAEFVQRLGLHLAGQWPAMQQQLDQRYAAFIELAVQEALKRGLARAAGVARYVNLCFVWGPGFQDKPGFDWARGLLAAPPEREWLTAHQLVQRSLRELGQLAGSRVEPATLQRVDAGLIEAFGRAGRHGAMVRPAMAELPPRSACDLEAVELRLLAPTEILEYRLEGQDWQRAARPLPAPLRIHAARPAPVIVGLLAAPPGEGPATRLQLRAATHAVCAGHHPALNFFGPHGLWAWSGHETRAVSWPVPTRPPLPAPVGPGCLIAEETSPELYRLELSVCGLRDEGEPLGALSTQVWAWPSSQWWFELQRAVPSLAPVRAGAPGPAPVTRCRVERDGQAQDGSALRQQFEQLDAAVAEALQKLALSWQQQPGIGATQVEALLGLLVGEAGVSWGWRTGAGGLDGAALMRVAARLEMQACQADIQCTAELDLAGTRSRLLLSVAGAAPLRQQLLRESAVPSLLEALLPAVARWRLPFELSLEPLAGDNAALLQPAGPPSGALVGEAGWRPCTKGRSGWEWYAGLRLEPVSVPVTVIDPLLGQQDLTLDLLPAMVLLDWSMG